MQRTTPESSTTPAATSEKAAKDVSFVELYLDLVFVLAVGQLAHLIVQTPRWHTVFVTLGLFVALWWTWVGFTVLYNRHGADDTWERVLFLLASVPVGAAAVAVGPASRGQITAFAVSLSLTRVLLAFGNARDDDPDSPVGDALRLRTTRAYVVSAVLFTASIWVPEPFSYAMWAIAYLNESRVMLTSPGRRSRSTTKSAVVAHQSLSDSGAALDAHHFAERFNLFIIILLGEVVVEAGEAAADGRNLSAGTWSGLVAAMALAAIFWWSYFDATAEINLERLERSGGSPAVARAIFAAGQMLPAFALLVAAAGIGLLLREDPTRAAYWLTSVGAGSYLAGTSTYIHARTRPIRIVRTIFLVVTYAFGALHSVLSPISYLWLLTAWVAGNAALAELTKRGSRSASRERARPLATDAQGS